MGRMKFRVHSDPPLRRKARKGFRGYPAATVIFYGPDDQRASKVAVGVIKGENEEVSAMRKWFDEHGDLRADDEIGKEIMAFLEQNGVKSVIMASRIMGCPHEEGIDYPDGEVCPQCPFWANRDRFAGEEDEEDA